MSDRVTSPSPDALTDRVVVADGAMGAVLRSDAPALDDFAGHEGRTKGPEVTGPDVVPHPRRCRPGAGADAVKTDTFGSNPAETAGPGTGDLIFGLSRRGAEPAPRAHRAGAKHINA